VGQSKQTLRQGTCHRVCFFWKDDVGEKVTPTVAVTPGELAVASLINLKIISSFFVIAIDRFFEVKNHEAQVLVYSACIAIVETSIALFLLNNTFFFLN